MVVFKLKANVLLKNTYLVDSYDSEDLTEDGKLALAETIEKRNKGDKKKAKYAMKKKRVN